MADGSPHPAPHPDPRLLFASLYRQHAGMVRRALRQLGVAPVSLDDAVQDVFVVLHRRIDDFQPERSLKNWLWGIARGVASGYRRSARRRARLHAALPGPERPPRLERGVAQRQAAAILHEFLGSLDADKCAVFVLSEIEGRRGPEIAAQLGVNVNTVYARLRAARKRFDAAMQRHHAPAGRPVLGAWLPWAWLGKPAATAGVSAVVVAATLSGTRPAAIPSAQPVPRGAVSSRGVAPSRGVVPSRGVAHRWPDTVTPRVALRPAPAPDRVLLAPPEPPPPSRRVVASSRRAEVSVEAPVAAPVAAPAAALSAAPAAAAEPLAVPPARAPWSSHVEGHRSVRHPSLVAVRPDFVAELWRIAARL